jgi:hypothetical protein
MKTAAINPKQGHLPDLPGTAYRYYEFGMFIPIEVEAPGNKKAGKRRLHTGYPALIHQRTHHSCR